MLRLLVFIGITYAYAENCSYTYDGVKYSKREILKVDGLPTNLAYNPNTKELHFTLIDVETLQNDDVQTQMDQYILREGELIKIDDVNGQAAAVDIEDNEVYIASDKGLNILNGTKANLLTMENEDIVQIFKPKNGHHLYTITFPDSEVFVLDLNTHKKRRMEYVPCAFILSVDADENIFYECDSKYVKMLLKGFQEPIEFVGIPKNSARALAVDEFNRVILAANDGLYWLKPDSVIPKKLMYLDFVPSGIALGDSNLYLSTSGNIYEYSGDHCN